MRGKAEIGLITVGDRPTVLAPHTTDTEVLNKQVRRIFPRTNSGAYLLDAIVDASKALAKREAKRPVILAITFEGVEHSNVHHDTVLKELAKSGAALHVIAIGTPSSSLDDEMRTRGLVLSEGTAGTGGRRDQVLAVSGIPDNLKQAADELLNQHVDLWPPRKLIPPEKITVTTTKSNVTVRARTRVGRAESMPARKPTIVGITGLLCAAALLATPTAQTSRAGARADTLPGRHRSRRHAVTEGNRFVTDLEEGDIEIFEDGVKQETTFFSKVQQPIALAVLLDTSASMESKLETAQEAAIGFARRMRSGDLMEVIDFDSQVSILQGFTNDVAALERAIRQATVNGSTSLYNAIYVSLKDLKKARISAAPRSGVRPSSCCPTATTPRAWWPTTKCSTSRSSGDGDLRDRTQAERRRPPRFQGSGVRPQAAVAGNRRTRSIRTACPSCRRSTSSSPRS